MDQDATWYGGRPRPGYFVFDVDPAPPSPRKKGHTHLQPFLAHVYCGQMTGWMKTPLDTEVDLGPGHIVLDGVPAASERGTAAPTIFSACVYCGHGRRSQLLLSSCFDDGGGVSCGLMWSLL